MYQLLVCLRALQIIAHHYHNLCARVAFQADHEFFKEVYESAEEDYDSVIERIIGIQGEDKLNLQALMMAVIKKVGEAPSVGVSNNKVFYEEVLKHEIYICDIVKEVISTSMISPGTEQLIGEIANKSEVRQYKIKQRIKE